MISRPRFNFRRVTTTLSGSEHVVLKEGKDR